MNDAKAARVFVSAFLAFMILLWVLILALERSVNPVRSPATRTFMSGADRVEVFLREYKPGPICTTQTVR